MNANELADELDWMTPEKLVGWCNSVQAMLRQQQAEIEVLKYEKSSGVYDDEPSYFGLTNDHTWLSVDEKYYKKLKPTHRMKCYTHPAKTLTDAEIDEVIEMVGYPRTHAMDIYFARAILKKANEK